MTDQRSAQKEKEQQLLDQSINDITQEVKNQLENLEKK